MTTTSKTMVQKKPAAPTVTPVPKLTPRVRADVPQTVDRVSEAEGHSLAESAGPASSNVAHAFGSLRLFPEVSEESVQRQEEEEEEEGV